MKRSVPAPTDARLSEEQVALSAYWPFRRAVDVDMVDGCEHSPDQSHFVCGHCEQVILVRVLVPILQRFRGADQREIERLKAQVEVLNEALVDVRGQAETIISTVGKGALRAVSATREELKP